MWTTQSPVGLGGNIVLSTFVYAGILAIIIPMNREKLDIEVAAEDVHNV